ncbi:DUF1990 domain-containing protein [Actinacidiphila acidipaludis]|uniref:DUF1990 domain-containing protein n=1 Tax=Actinacidiphila acidipaludis TaxID=2873382 RepID=A0ABS7QGC9_9ACTN|nr:DUF1990 domain-containing protein [Streptomyces acidipaludis]MBY8882003.1 DUF1990 domain-containing protein [Streptomyces acidipaludis]
MHDLTYPSPGLTAGEGEPSLPGFHTLRLDTDLPPGLFDAAADALFGWRMHRAVPLLRVDAEQPQAATGVRVVLRFGPVAAPCRVVWAVRDENQAAFAYGTLPGHPESGEEAFVLRRDPDGGAVTFTVLAVSRPAAWYARAAGPLGRLLQRTIAVRYAAALRTAATRPS